VRVVDPGEGGHAGEVRVDGISSHSCFAIVLMVRKKGHKSVSSWREACASAVSVPSALCFKHIACIKL